MILFLYLETPLTLATKVNRCRSLILQLVGGGAHLDFRNKRSLTAVHMAAVNGNAEAIKVSQHIIRAGLRFFPHKRCHQALKNSHHSIIFHIGKGWGEVFLSNMVINSYSSETAKLSQPKMDLIITSGTLGVIMTLIEHCEMLKVSLPVKL